MQHPLLICSISFTKDDSAQGFNIEQRVICQTIIEDIRWSHRIWPIENKTPKPQRSEVLSDQQIREKVENSMKMEADLVGLYGIEVDGVMLQAELDRMSQSTKAPERLQELFKSLDNDPVSIAECLARPTLVRKHLYNSYIQDGHYHNELKMMAEQALNHQDDLDALIASGAIESLRVLLRKVINLDISTIEQAERDNGFMPILLENDQFDAEVSRLTVSSELRETSIAYVYERLLNQTNDRLEVRSLVWQKQSFDEWWLSQSEKWTWEQDILISMSLSSAVNASGALPVETAALGTGAAGCFISLPLPLCQGTPLSGLVVK